MPTHRTVMAIAVPVMISNVSTPLIGLVDTGVVGQLSDPAYIGAVAVGALIFDFVFWAFGFLRMGTTGMTAQASGANDRDEVLAVLGRALLAAVAIGLALILVQWPVREAAFAILDGSGTVEQLARRYFDIRIWAAPATLANYALLGWFIGLGRTDIALILQLVLNITNILLDSLFVLGFHWDVQGVALGTLVAECTAAVTGIIIAVRYARAAGGNWHLAQILLPERLKRTFVINGDIMIRSLSLVAVFAWFTARGAEQGDVILAANAVLLHFVALAAFFLDGLAFAAETLVGRVVGAAHKLALTAAVRITSGWAVGVAIFLSAGLWLFGSPLVNLLTVDPAARTVAHTFLVWAAASPLLGVWAFQLDGIFIGATRTNEMRNAMLVSLGIYLGAWWLFKPYGNTGLWAAFYVHYLARIGTLGYFYPRLLRSVPAQGTSAC